jgi:type IV pilus assembly protein PilW
MRQSSRLGASRLQGVTLIELMIAVVLGLMILAVAITTFVSNKRVYSSTESLGRIQENTRTAFELMARDVREAAGNACERDLTVVNALNTPTANWWTDFAGGLTGYDGGTAFPDAAFGAAGSTSGLRVAGTDAVDLKSAISSGVTIVDHQPASADFKLNTNDHGINPGDVVMACDFDHAAIFQITNAQPGTNPNVVHNTGEGVPGNATKCLSTTGVCSSTGYVFGCKGGEAPPSGCAAADRWPAQIVKLRMTRWYVGHNPRGGQSLYQSGIQNSGGTLSVVNNEIVEGVRNMQLTYLVDGAGDYAAAGPGLDWSKVVSVRIDLRMEGEGREGTDGNVLRRNLIHTVAIRNRTL